MRTERWDNGQGQGEEDDNGGVDPGKAGDERLALGFPFAGMLHKGDDLRDGALAKGLRGTDAEDAGEVHTTGDHLVADIHDTGQRLTRQSDGIQGTRSLNHHTVQGDFLTWFDHDD